MQLSIFSKFFGFSKSAILHLAFHRTISLTKTSLSLRSLEKALLYLVRGFSVECSELIGLSRYKVLTQETVMLR